MSRARWLLQSAGSWISPAAAGSLVTRMRGLPLHACATLGSDAAVSQSAAVVHSCQQLIRGYSTPSTSSDPRKESGSGGGTSAERFQLPAFFRHFFPAAKHLPAPAPRREAAGSPSQDKDESKGASSEEAKDIEEMDRLRSMDMQGYVEYCKQLRSGTTPPRPRPPPVPRGHPDYLMFQDLRRISYLRFQQHERIGSMFTAEESALVVGKGEEVLRDRKLLQAIADRTGVYIDLEVKDCIKEFLNTRKLAGRFYRYVKEFGHPMPETKDEQDAAVKFVQRIEAEEKLGKALAGRDPASCPLQRALPWASAGAICERTQLRYWQCCGALDAQAGQQLPHHLRKYLEGSEKEAILQRELKREAYQKFKSRSQSRLRKAYLMAQKPRFRDY